MSAYRLRTFVDEVTSPRNNNKLNHTCLTEKRTGRKIPFVVRRADSSAVEHLLYTQGVVGSNPASPTK